LASGGRLPGALLFYLPAAGDWGPNFLIVREPGAGDPLSCFPAAGQGCIQILAVEDDDQEHRHGDE
jgi:hypothetical protein